MKVAYLGIKGIPSCAGADRVVEAIATRMPTLGISPTVYCDRSLAPGDISFPGVNLVRLAPLKGKYTGSTSLDLLAASHAVLSGDYDLIHLHNVEASFVLPLLRCRYPVVSTSHGSAYWRAKWGQTAKHLIKMMDIPFVYLSTAVTCVAARDAREMSSRFDRPIPHIPNGVGREYSADREGARQILARHGLLPGNYFIFAAGRIEPTKGAHLAIEAVNRLEGDKPLLVVGDDSHLPEYSRQLHLAAGPRVRFQQFVEKPALLYGLMAQASALIFPSTVEAMSMVLLEAACIGMPILASDIPENRDVLCSDAVYFQSGNAGSLASKLEWAQNHRAEIKSLADRGRVRIKGENNWDSIAARYASLYSDVLSRSTRSLPEVSHGT
jgi:glycosyltransferase involved in cell wall biosynthesis